MYYEGFAEEPSLRIKYAVSLIFRKSVKDVILFAIPVITRTRYLLTFVCRQEVLLRDLN
jgi:hypothetical protein